MAALLFALLTIVSSVAVNLTLREAAALAPVGLLGVASRIVTLPLLAAWVLARGNGFRRLRPRRNLKLLAWMGLISIAINLFWFASLKWTTATNVAVIYRLDLVFVVLIGAGLGLERIGRAQLALLPVLLVGFALFTQIGNFDLGGHLSGDLMVVAAALGFAVNAFIIRRILQTMDEEAVALYNHAISTLGFVALALVHGEFADFSRLFEQARLGWLIVLLGVLLAVSLPLYYAALKRIQVWKLRALLLSAPLLTAAIECPFWGVRLSPLQCLGGAIILAGLAALIRLEARPGGAFAPLSAGQSTTTAPAFAPAKPSLPPPSPSPYDQTKDKIA